jgi:hypothetical protein
VKLPGRFVWAGVLSLVLVALAIDLSNRAVRGLWPAALSLAVGILFLWRTQEEVSERFEGPQRHRRWLEATAWFFIVAGLVGMLLSLLG